MKPWLKLTSNVAYTHYNSNYSVTNKDDWNSTSSGNIFYVANFMSPVYPLYVRDANGKIMKDANGFTIYDYGDGKGLTDYAGSRTFMSGSNPPAVVSWIRTNILLTSSADVGVQSLTSTMV